MRKKLITVITLVALLSLIPQFVYANEINFIEDSIDVNDLERSDFDIGPMASHYISSYETYLRGYSKGKLLLYADVIGTDIMDKIGLSNVYVQEYNSGSWNTVMSFSDYKYKEYDYLNEFILTVVSGRTYRTIVYFYSEKNGGSDTRSVITSSVVAP